VPPVAGECVDCGPHRCGVPGSRAAAATYDRRARGEHPRHHFAEVLWLGRVDEPAFDTLRQAGVGLQRASDCRCRRPHPDDGLQARQRARAAVDADGIHAGLGQCGGRGLWTGPVAGEEILAECHLGDDWQVAGAADLFDGGEQRFEVAESLAAEQVDSALEQPLHLLAEGGPSDPRMQPIRNSPNRPQRTDRSGHERLASGHVPGFTGELGAAAVDPRGQLLQAELRQPEAVCAEGVRFDRVRARLQVLAMDRRHDVGVGQYDLVEAGPLRYAAAVEQRAHGAVEEQRPAPQQDAKALTFRQDPGHAGCGGARPGRGEQVGRRRGRHDGHAGKPSGSVGVATRARAASGSGEWLRGVAPGSGSACLGLADRRFGSTSRRPCAAGAADRAAWPRH
jgi:hypothetical protein